MLKAGDELSTPWNIARKVGLTGDPGLKEGVVAEHCGDVGLKNGDCTLWNTARKVGLMGDMGLKAWLDRDWYTLGMKCVIRIVRSDVPRIDVPGWTIHIPVASSGPSPTWSNQWTTVHGYSVPRYLNEKKTQDACNIQAMHALCLWITGCEEGGACRIKDMEFTIIKWTLVKKVVFWIMDISGIKLQVKKVTENIEELWQVEFSCQACYILCMIMF
ncbi:hypothetical protein V8B97DRAFT_1918512 [Scleroderma yunnanense]